MSSRINAFLLAACTTVAGCGTAPTYQGTGLSNITAGIRNAVTGVGNAAVDMVTPSGDTSRQVAPTTLNPNLAQLLKEDTEAKIAQLRPEDRRVVRVPDYGAKCYPNIKSFAMGNTGPGPLGNPHNSGSLPNVGTGVIQGLWNQATGGRANAGARAGNELGNGMVMDGAAAQRQWANVCNDIGKLSVAAYQADANNPQGSPGWKSEWRAITGQTPRLTQLALNADIGLSSMAEATKNRALTTLGNAAAARVLPQYQNGPGGVAGGLFRRALD